MTYGSIISRLTRTENFPAGNRTFTVRAKGGVRFWLDGSLKIDQWSERTSVQTFTWTGDLTAGNHELKLEYFDNDNSALIAFSAVALSATLVTKNTDDGQFGSLSYALNHVRSSNGGTINFGLNEGDTITVNGTVNIPPNVVVEGNCSTNGPAITLSGANLILTLEGNVNLQGVKVNGKLRHTGKGNKLLCVNVT